MNSNSAEQPNKANHIADINTIGKKDNIISVPSTDKYEYNELQQKAIDTICSGESCLITGPAGAGKTVALRLGILNLILQNTAMPIQCSDHKYLHEGMLDFVILAYTNKAIENIKKHLPEYLHKNCMTIHKFLEFAPNFYIRVDDEGNQKTVRIFEPGRTLQKPVPDVCKIIIDEASMVPVSLWNMLAKAIANTPQLVQVGDIHQLPPVFGKSIFIHTLQMNTKKIELKHIYRQALASPIITLAHRIKDGKQILPKDLVKDFSRETDAGTVFIRPWKKRLNEIEAIRIIGGVLVDLIDSGTYNPYEDIIITPFNKAFGTIIMNIIVANKLIAAVRTEGSGDGTKCQVYEIFAGIKKCYFRIGERVLYNKSEAIITKIERNGAYYGNFPRPPSVTMDYNGVDSGSAARNNANNNDSTISYVDDLLHDMRISKDDDENGDAKGIPREASHKITIYNKDLDTEIELTTSGEIGLLDLGYALTVHKAQGSEYEKVFFITHNSQAIALYRELLYTAVTRASKMLYIICENNLFVKGIVSQRVPGNTLEEKIESFKRAQELSKAKDEMPIRKDIIEKSL